MRHFAFTESLLLSYVRTEKFMGIMGWPPESLFRSPVRGNTQLLDRNSPQSNPTTPSHAVEKIGSGGLRIRCPRCRWQPRQEDRWGCTCGHTWNTFDTGGVCPQCRTVWQKTQCLHCQLWSHHEDWYVWEEQQGRK